MFVFHMQTFLPAKITNAYCGSHKTVGIHHIQGWHGTFLTIAIKLVMADHRVGKVSLLVKRGEGVNDCVNPLVHLSMAVPILSELSFRHEASGEGLQRRELMLVVDVCTRAT